jgi:hypothetical protein
MLMPAVTPVPTAGTRPGKPPIETLSFDSLLQEAKTPSATGITTGIQTDPQAPVDPNTQAQNLGPAEQAAKTDTLAPLTGIESIHNASLRRIVAQATGK